MARMNLALCTLCLLLAAASPLRAGNDDDIALGAIRGFASEAQARSECAGDGVVWADRKTGFLYPRYMEQYGRTTHGTYTCYTAARKADYWSFGAAEMMGSKGKTFPYDHCAACF